jgi:two-component system, NtrC family, response regulator AtoC
VSTTDQTIDAAGLTAAGEAESSRDRAFLVVYPGQAQAVRSRVVELPEGEEVTFGRSRGCTVMIDHDKVSRQHARVVRRGADIVVEDLGSRNGTRVNGTRIEGPTRVATGDEIGVGPATAVVGVSTRLRRRTLIGSTSYLEERLGAESDRALRYHRPLGLVMMRIDGAGAAAEAALERLAGVLRRMDCLAEYGPDEFAIVVPEADRKAAEATARRLVREARAGGLALGGVAVHVGVAAFPDDGSQSGELVSKARAALRTARTGGGAEGVATPPPEQPIVEGDLVVADPQMRRVHEMCAKIADTNMTVLVLGETGVGKELIAEALHQHSARKDRPLVKLNCASLPETLLESELFGYERGAFTGADKRKIGYFEAATGGTIFLDELGEMPQGLQAKLLRVLERRKITRVGGTSEIDVDVRVVGATNRDLEKEVQRGRFREDLFFRVSAFTLVVPPLRDRPSEVPLLAEHFARLFARELKQDAPTLSRDARERLTAYAWPGNVRELRNAIERAVVLRSGPTIEVEHLPERVREATSRSENPEAANRTLIAVGDGVDMREHIAEVERAAIVAALESCGGNQTRAADKLGVSRRALIYKMEKYGLKAPPGGSK